MNAAGALLLLLLAVADLRLIAHLRKRRHRRVRRERMGRALVLAVRRDLGSEWPVGFECPRYRNAARASIFTALPAATCTVAFRPR